MLTKEFIKKLETLEFVGEVEAPTSNYIVVRSKENAIIASSDINTEIGFDIFWISFNNLKLNEKKDLLDLLVEYTTTPVDERKVKLTEDERVILTNINDEYKWIARDKYDGIFVFNEKPEQGERRWYAGMKSHLTVYNHLFQFIKWEDDKPYEIKELLDGL